MDSEAVSQFVGVTGATPDAAQFFLESANGDMAAAIDQYFTSGGQAHQEEAVPASADVQQAAVPTAITPATANAASSVSANKPAAGKAKKRTGGVRSLADVAKDSEEDSDVDEGNEYYAGGQKSGQVVKGAPKNKDSGQQVSSIFERARALGASEGSIADLQQPSSSGGGAFTGQSRTLAGGSAAPPAATPAAPSPASSQPIVHTITFYSNQVFTVDDGEPRSINDPANRPFMESITRGECPAELDPGSRTQQVSVNLVRSEKPYEAPPKPKHRAFTGTGQTLAGPSNTATGSTSQPAASTTVSSPWAGVNEAEPATSIQFRLADGSRMVARFNLTHTVSDIRQFIKASRPDIPQGYALQMAGFPPKQLTNDSETIKDAGLEGSVVIQKQ
ncbi:hypothetical protein ABBQ32_004990 [Trebouxia sp. C0010 RCD-2024]